MDKAALLKEIIEWGRAYPERREGDVTVRDYAEADEVKIDITTARRRLDKMVTEGKLVKLKVDHGVWVYRKA